MLPEVRERLEELASRLGIRHVHPAAALAVAALAVCLVWWALARWGGGASVTAEADTFRSGATPTAEAPQVDRGGEDASRSAPASAAVVVHVVGAVRRPGVYRLPAGSRGDDAVRAAGGTLGAADIAAVNLARVLTDGEQVAIPVQGATPPTGSATAAAGSATGGGGAGGGAPGAKVSLNAATASQLDSLPGIGPATAQKIVADREKNGPFANVDDLARVPGIGPKKVDALKDLVTAP